MIKQEQETWLPGIRPEVDWAMIPVGSTWQRRSGSRIRILSVDKEKQTVTILTMHKHQKGEYAYPDRQDERSAYAVIKLLQELFEEE